MRRLWQRLADWCVPARALDLPTWEWTCFYPPVRISGTVR